MGEFADRMKAIEDFEVGRKLMPMLPACARLDGKCFGTFTRGLNKPYDERFCSLMRDLLKYMVEETNALMGYTQSDEISLVWYSPDYKSQIFFNGRIQKMVGDLAGMASVKFNALLRERLPEKVEALPRFDCRVWNVPSLTEAANVFLWRELDATKNSISTLAQSLYSNKQLFGKNTSDMQEMIFERGDNWNNHPDYFKRGTFVQRVKEMRRFTPEELEKLPPLHEARKNPDLEIERSGARELEMPPFNKVTNRVGVVFDGEEPIEVQVVKEVHYA